MDRKRHKQNGVYDRRLHINIFNIVFTCVVLITAKAVAGGDLTEKIHKISKDLNKSLQFALDNQMTNYSSIYQNVTYHSTTNFNAKGMSVLYNVTKNFMDLITPKNVYPEGLIKVQNGNIEIAPLEENWQSILAHYGAIVAIITVLLLFVIFMPICGFFFCCCRCCGKCGARSKPFDKKGDLCKKICLASLLICVGTLLLFGVVCAFVTNQSLQDNTSELPDNFKNSIKDTDSYLMYTSWQINVLLNVNYKEFENSLFTTLDECSDVVSKQLEEASNATLFTQIVEIVDGLYKIKENLHFVQESTKMLQRNASQLADGLRKVQKDLLNILKECNDIQQCSKLSNDYINTLRVNIDFDNLPTVSEPLTKLDHVLNTNIKDAVNKGEKALQGIRDEINHTVDTELPNIKESIKRVGKEIIKYGSNIISVITRARDSLHVYIDKPIVQLEKNIKEYTPYRYYLGIAISCILLLVSLCIALGLICGICGKRPDAYGDDCCNKGAGSRFLMMGVAIMFLFSMVLAAVAIIHFCFGISAQKIVCDSLRNPNESQLIHLIDDVINLNESIGVDVKVSTILTAMHKNESIYRTFNLKKYFDLKDIESYMDKLEVKERLEQLKDKINPNTNIELINKDAEQHLIELIESGIDDIEYDKFLYAFDYNLTTFDLTTIADKLDALANALNNENVNRKHIVLSLMLSSLHLRTYQSNLVNPMMDTSKDLIKTVRMLKSGFDSTVIQNLLAKLKKAETALKEEGKNSIAEISTNFALGLEKQVKVYLNRTVVYVQDYLGISGPIGNIFNATLVATCDKILLPWNGFWFSILWCLLIFIPAIILSVKLAALYQKYEAYPGPLVEAEYLYDAYAERDNIPLSSSRNSRHKKKMKKHKRRDGRGAYTAESPTDHGIAREVPSGSTRYADMAPKHWEEFPAGGPPHYQRAPTEYERPPPYYYPNTEQQQ